MSNSPSLMAVSRLATILLTLLTAPIIARELGPAGRGIYAACLASMTLMPSIVGVGLPMVVRRRSVKDDSGPLLRTVYRMLPLLAIPSFLSGVVIALYFIPELTGFETVVFLVGTVVSTVFVGTLSAQSVLLVSGRYLAVSILLTVQTVTVAIGTIGGWLAGTLSLSWLVASFGLGTLLSAIVGIIQVRVGLFGSCESPRSLLAEGSRFSLSQLAEVASGSIYPILAVTAVGSIGAGYFAVAVTVSSLPLAIGFAVGSVAFRDIAITPELERIRLAGMYIRASMLFGVLCAASLAIISPFAIPLVFGDEFNPSIILTLIMLFGSGAILSNYVSTQMLGAMGKGLAMTLSQVAGIAVGAASIYMMGALWGAVGAACAVVLAWLVTMLMSLGFLGVGFRGLIPTRNDPKFAWSVVVRGGA